MPHMENAAPARPKQRVCPWCTSTVTIAAKRCVFCGMSLGEELRAAGVSLTVTMPTTASARPAPRHALQYLREVLAILAIIVLALVVTSLLLHTARF